jgi:hypothetical protein
VTLLIDPLVFGGKTEGLFLYLYLRNVNTFFKKNAFFPEKKSKNRLRE